MLTELGGKAGRVCDLVMNGAVRCPLIVRPTSEDVVTGHLFGTLQAINPRWWLPDLLNQALGTKRFRTQVFRNLQIELWQKQPKFPRWLMPWEEGNSEIDVVITWENPATTLFIEMKYGANLAATTVHNNGKSGFPADQLIRNARIGLYRCGWYQEETLFDLPRRNFLLLLMSPQRNNPLVAKYRDEGELRTSIPHSERISELPPGPFIGEMNYVGMGNLLAAKAKFMTRPEKTLVRRLEEYLNFKLVSLNLSRN